MKKLASIFVFFFSVHAEAQKLYLYPTAAVAPRGSYQTITAIVTGVNDKTVTWTTSGGKLVGTNPCVVNEPCTIALYTKTAGTYTLTARSNANRTVRATSTITITPSPTSVTTHPRLYITAAMLSGLQAKATSGNTVFQALHSQAVTAYTTNNQPYWSWSCNSGTGLPSNDESSFDKEQNAYLFAYLGLIYPTDATYNWGCYAHDLMLYVMNQIMNGTQNPIGNPWSDNSQMFTLTPDWVMGGGTPFNGGTGATATATLTGSTMNTPTVTTGGTSYAAGKTYKWYATGGSCTAIGHQNTATTVATGTVAANGSGVIAGTMTVTANATGCSTAPAIVIFTEQDVTRAYLAYIARTVMNYSYGTNAPVAPGYNSPSLIVTRASTDLANMRWLGNNYTFSKLLYLGAAGLTFNDNMTDDPPLANTCSATRYQVCSDFTAGSLHAYYSYLAGGYLYMEWAHLSDQSVVQQAYNAAYSNVPSIPNCLYGGNLSTAVAHPCYGDGRGGESAEGSFYDYSKYRLRMTLNLMHTAGVDDPLVWGPQMSLSTDSYWDLMSMEDSSFLTTNAIKNGPTLGSPAFSYLTTGDTNTYYRVPLHLGADSGLMVFDTYTGRSDRMSSLEWPILNVSFGGPDGSGGGCTIDCGFSSMLHSSYADATTPIPYDLYIALPAGDPVASPPADPRPGYPTDYYNASFNQHTMIRSGWGSGYTLFSEYCPNAMADHEGEFCGRFDIMANNEYITKGRVVFDDYNAWITAAPQQNIASIINTDNHSAPCLSCTIGYAVAGGGQGYHSQQQNLATNLHSELPAYAVQIANTTGVSNYWWTWWGPVDYDDVTGSSRSIVYLRGSNQVVFYDRATTGHANAKSISQITTGPITLAGSVASWPTRSGTQKAYFTSLLPSGATVSDAGLPCVGCSVDQAWDWEPASTIKVSAGKPLSTQFLSVIEWGPSSLKQSTTTLVHSTSGMNFDGALIGSSLVMFMRNWPATFTSTMFPASGATAIYVSDLTPNTSYAVAGAGAPSSATTDTAGVLTFKAAGTGDVTIRAAQSVRVGLSVQTDLYVVGATIALSAIAFAVARGASQFQPNRPLGHS